MKPAAVKENRNGKIRTETKTGSKEQKGRRRTMKRVSVAMAVYNGETYLREQLESILEQLGSKDEIVISDDGSTDHTIEMIRSYALKDSPGCGTRTWDEAKYCQCAYADRGSVSFSGRSG